MVLGGILMGVMDLSCQSASWHGKYCISVYTSNIGKKCQLPKASESTKLETNMIKAGPWGEICCQLWNRVLFQLSGDHTVFLWCR